MSDVIEAISVDVLDTGHNASFRFVFSYSQMIYLWTTAGNHTGLSFHRLLHYYLPRHGHTYYSIPITKYSLDFLYRRFKCAMERVILIWTLNENPVKMKKEFPSTILLKSPVHSHYGSQSSWISENIRVRGTDRLAIYTGESRSRGLLYFSSPLIMSGSWFGSRMICDFFRQSFLVPLLLRWVLTLTLTSKHPLFPSSFPSSPFASCNLADLQSISPPSIIALFSLTS